MNYYLVEVIDTNNKLRHYKNSRVANYTRDCLNRAEGYERYMVITDDEPVVTVSVNRKFAVDPLSPVDQVISRLS